MDLEARIQEARDYILDILDDDHPNVGVDDIKNILNILTGE